MLRRDMLISVLGAACLACGRGAVPRGQAGARTAAAASINGLAVELHRTLATRPGNLVVSPASLLIALAMIHAGARGATQAALESKLKVEDADFSGLLRRWDVEDDGLVLKVSSRLFGDRGVEFSAEFLALLRERFAAPLESLEMRGAPTAARERVNGWVAERTLGRVKDLLPPGAIDERTRLVLASAVYFKAKWAEEFEPRSTGPGTFHAPGGARQTPMMTRSGELRLGVGVKEKVRLLELKYRGGAFAMLIILPDGRDRLAAVEATLDAATLQRWIDTLALQKVEIQVPKFRVEPPTLAVADALRAVGLGAVFDADADLTGMAPASERLVLAQAYHKTFLELDEQGTEAAAATAIKGEERGMPPPKPRLEFIVDHPFLFLIRDTRDGSILFMGRIADPTEA